MRRRSTVGGALEIYRYSNLYSSTIVAKQFVYSLGNH